MTGSEPNSIQEDLVQAKTREVLWELNKVLNETPCGLHPNLTRASVVLTNPDWPNVTHIVTAGTALMKGEDKIVAGTLEMWRDAERNSWYTIHISNGRSVRGKVSGRSNAKKVVQSMIKRLHVDEDIDRITDGLHRKYRVALESQEKESALITVANQLRGCGWDFQEVDTRADSIALIDQKLPIVRTYIGLDDIREPIPRTMELSIDVEVNNVEDIQRILESVRKIYEKENVGRKERKQTLTSVRKYAHHIMY
jgi:hypothetical protein